MRARLPRGVPGRSWTTLPSLGYEVLSAIEYEDPDLGSRRRAADVERHQLQPQRDRALRTGSWTSFGSRGFGRHGRRALRRCTRRPGRDCSSSTSGPAAGWRAQGGRRHVREVRDEAGGAASMGLRASFLAKTVPGEEGSSGHVHLSLWGGQDERVHAGLRNQPHRVPAVFTSAVAGVLEHLPGASLLVNPTVNSYKRLVPGWFAPINATWGYENRSCCGARRSARRGEPNSLAPRVPEARARMPTPTSRSPPSQRAGGRRHPAEEQTPPAPIEGDAYARSDLPELAGVPRGLRSRAFEEDRVFGRPSGTASASTT